MTHPQSNPADLLKANLQGTPECLGLDRYGEALSAAERTHADACPRCRAELTLFTEFQDSTPSADEGAAVEWVTREIRRRLTAVSRPTGVAVLQSWWSELFSRRWVTAAVAATLVAAVSFVAWDREPALRDPQNQTQTPVYRTEKLVVIGPVGEQKVAPPTFEWEATDGVVLYTVHLLEVDGTTLWQASVAGTRVSLPRSVQSQVVPGKTLLWNVVGLSSAGVAVAESGPQRFRVIF